jgi:predicted AAA+ superfamily ATPase
MMTRVDKPALLRQLFHLGCRHACEILSYTKMLGQLQETGNTTTLAHYLDLLASAGLLCGIPRFAGRAVRQRASSPKLVPPNTALMSATSHLAPSETRADGEAWGRLVECAVGAHLLGAAAWGQIDVFYWRERNREIDFVVRSGRTVIGIEVKSGRERGALRGVEAFTAAFRPRRTILVGTGGVPLEEFLSGPLNPWLT